MNNFLISREEIEQVLRDDDPRVLEDLAQKAARLTQQYFGRTVSLYTPLYLSNYCNSRCLYCGFNQDHIIPRRKLTSQQMRAEMEQIAHAGIENILLLTGEAPEKTPMSYLKEAVQIAQKYFSNIALEIFPLETAGYKELYEEGVNGVTLYQETYNRDVYQQVHLQGKKKDYDFRYCAPRRMAEAGIRQITMGILLGLCEAGEDLFALYQHLRWMEKNFPGVEYSLSFPRLRKAAGALFNGIPIPDAGFIKILCLTRILFPRVGINLSTRENAKLRDHALALGVTRISAGSRTTVGGYTLVSENPSTTPQFEIEDRRSVQDIISSLKRLRFDPVLTDWRSIPNETPSLSPSPCCPAPGISKTPAA